MHFLRDTPDQRGLRRRPCLDWNTTHPVTKCLQRVVKPRSVTATIMAETPPSSDKPKGRPQKFAFVFSSAVPWFYDGFVHNPECSLPPPLGPPHPPHPPGRCNCKADYIVMRLSQPSYYIVLTCSIISNYLCVCVGILFCFVLFIAHAANY